MLMIPAFAVGLWSVTELDEHAEMRDSNTSNTMILLE